MASLSIRPHAPGMTAILVSLLGVIPYAEGQAWRQSSFEDFRQGRSDDGGVNLYAAADGTVRTILTFDYNRDGANDVLFVTSHDNWYAPPAYLYLNSGGTFDPRFRQPLLNSGSHAGAIGDLNGDGWPEVVLCATHNGQNYAALDALVYYGSEMGFARRRSQALPTYFSTGVAILDANADGQPDLAFAQGQSPGIVIYLNQAGGFDPCAKQVLPCGAVSWCQAADADGDGRVDLLALNGSDLLIYRNTGTELAGEPTTRLSTAGSGRFTTSDLNRDGHLDVVITNSRAKGRVDLEDAERKGALSGAVVYWGDAAGTFTTTASTTLPCSSSRDVAAADLNHDDWPDVIIADYGNDDETGDAPTSIYWGGPDGFGVERRGELATRFAHGLATADLNADGWADVIVACHRNGSSHNVESYVYMNNQGHFEETRPTGLPTLGAVAAVVGDVDRNGQPDVLFLNSVDGTKGLSNARLYWNNGNGEFSTERMALLPIHDAFSHVATDLNLDGRDDIVFAESYEYGRWRDEGSCIYWGQDDGTWSPQHRSLVPTEFATGVVSGDLDRDGWLDLAFAQLVTWEPGFKPEDRYQLVCYGGPNGFDAKRTTRLKVEDPRGLTLADLNRDGRLDLIYSNLSFPHVVIFWGTDAGFSDESQSRIELPDKGSVTVNCVDINGDGWLDVAALSPYHYEGTAVTAVDRMSYIFLGSAEGFSAERRIDLPTVGVQGSCFADFDRDGMIDVFLPTYTNGQFDRTWTSLLYYQGKDGFSRSRRSGLLTDSGSGAVALDYNRDGWLDLAVACHALPNGNHRARSFIFLGSPDGFSDYRKIELPTEGSHDITDVDAGHVYHRRFEIAFTSTVHDMGSEQALRAINWKARTPHGSRLRFQLRAADDPDDLESTPWYGREGVGGTIDEPGDLRVHPIRGRHVQYRAIFQSADGSNYPVLDEVTIAY